MEAVMRRVIFMMIFVVVSVFSCGPTEQIGSTEERLAMVDELNAFAKEHSIKAEFAVDPNNDRTLVFYRITSLNPEDIVFSTAITGYGSSVEKLKSVGFSAVRVYSSKTGANEYDLQML